MSGVMYLGNQIVTPVIVKGSGIDTSKYEQLPYITMWENDYIALENDEDATKLKLEYITNDALSDTIYQLDMLECSYMESSYTSGWKCYQGNSEIAYLNGISTKLKGPLVLTSEGFYLSNNNSVRVLKSKDRIVVVGDIQVTNRSGASLTIQDTVLNLDGYVNNANYTQDIIFDNTLLNVTDNTQSKELWWTNLKGSLGFYVEPTANTVFPITFTIRATTVDSGFSFIDNDLYNATVVTREENGFIYKDISISPKTKQEVLALGYTESEYNAIKSVESVNAPQDELYYSKIKYDSAIGYVYRVHGESHYLLNKIYRLVQEGKTAKARNYFSNKITGYTSRLVRAGSYYAVKRLSDNAEGVVDIESGEFYPVVKMPVTLTINVMVQEGDLTTHPAETPVTCSYIVDGEPVQETGTTLQVFPGSSVSYTVTETADDWKEFTTGSGSISNIETDITASVTLQTSRKIVFPDYGEGVYYYWSTSSESGEKVYGNYVVIPPNIRTGYYIHIGRDNAEGYYYWEYYARVTEKNGYIDYSVYTDRVITYTDYFSGSVVSTNFRDVSTAVLVTFQGFPTDESLKGVYTYMTSSSATDAFVHDIGEQSSTFPEIQKNQAYIGLGYFVYNVQAFKYSEGTKAYLPYKIYPGKESAIQITEPNTVIPFSPVIKSFTTTTDYSRPNISASGTLWVDPLAVSGPAYSSTYSDWKAFDGNTSTYYRTATKDNSLTITFDKPVELTQLQFTCNSTSTAPTNVLIYGLVKNQDDTVTEYTLNSSSGGSTTFNVNLLESSQAGTVQGRCYAGPYQGYRIYLGRSSGTVYLKELGLVGKNVTEDS